MRPVSVAALALSLAGFALTLALFYPGIMTHDAAYVYLGIKEGPGDWQSPVMTWLWSVIDVTTPPSASVFLLGAATYWFAFGLIAINLSFRAPVAAIMLPLLAMTPPALSILGVIWRDVLLASFWLLAAALSFATARKAPLIRLPFQIAAIVLIVLGFLLRPNALPAAPILVIYALWPGNFRFWRSVAAYLPIALLLYALIPATYYGLLHAKKQHPLHSIFVFDLGGISHFAKENQFPVTWTPEQNALLLNECYKPTFWDIYWYVDPCKFVMERLDRTPGEKIFGTPAIAAAWREAILKHPLAYLQHRASFFWNVLTGRNLTMWAVEVQGGKPIFPDRPAFNAFKSLHDVLYPTPLFRAWPWLLACLALLALAWRKRETATGVFVMATCGSAAIYVLTLFLVGVASDFRYAYWAVLASLAGVPVLFAQRRVS
jgi:hypothetical protein